MQRLTSPLRAVPFLTSRWFLIAVMVVFAGLFVARQRTDLASFANAAAGIRPGWLAAIALVQCGVLVVTALVYQRVLARVGWSLSWRTTLDLHLRRHVVGTVTPIGGPASVVVYLRTLAGYGVATPDAALALALRSLTGYAAFIAILVPVLVVSKASGIVLAGGIALVIALAALLSLFLLLLHRHDTPLWAARRLPARVAAVLEDLRRHDLRARQLAAPFALGLLANLASATIVFFALVALGEDATLATAIVGYAIGNLFALIAPVFQGVGVVELSMTVALERLGVSREGAIAATLLYRVADVWLPLALGLLAQLARQAAVAPVLARVPVRPALALAGVGSAMALLVSLAPAQYDAAGSLVASVAMGMLPV